MKEKFYRTTALLWGICFFFNLPFVHAQNRPVTGTVVSARDRQPVIGATVLLKNTAVGTTTDTGGKFSLSAPADGILVVSFVGYTDREVPLNNQTQLTITLQEDAEQLDEVVVTALGIRKESKKLGYATATVNPEQLIVNRTPNVGTSLQGKVAGLNVTAPAAGPGSSAKVRIRGQSSFGGNNSPLIVVNGVPINNNPGSAGTGLNMGTASGSSSDTGDGLQSINQDDIESMTVLKGQAASALYGFRAKDGVIIITTKTGSRNGGIGVEINSNVQASQALDFTDFQYEYGQGEFGKRPTTTAEAQSSGVWSFGERFDGRPTPQFDGSTQPYSPHKNRIRDFYRTGLNFTNSVALSGGNEKGGFRLSFANTDASALIPNSIYHKKILNIGVNYKFTEKLTTQLNANYSNEYNKNPPQIGIQDMNANTTIQTMANSIDVDWLKNRKDANGNEMPLSRFTNRNNPFWVAYDRFENVRRDRVFGNALVRYQLLDWLYVQGRIGQDYFNRPYNYNRPTGTRSLTAAPAGLYNGIYYQDVTTFRETNLDFLVGGNREFGDFGVDITLGGNRLKQRTENISTYVTNFYARDVYSIPNGVVKNPNYYDNRLQVNSLYGAAEFSLKEFLFLNLTSRNDWFSTLNPQSNSVLYSSVSGSFVFSQAFAALPTWLNYGKIRAAYAEGGGATDPYTDRVYYTVNANTFNGKGLGYTSSTISPNPNLQPLKIKELEVGLELKTLDNRVSLDISAYRKNTEDEILNVDISNASGFSQTKVNLGRLQNKGIEALLTLVPVRSALTWETSFNGAYNKSKVQELASGQTRLDVGSGEFFGTVSHEIGQPLASLRGYDFKRDAQGRIITSNGLFQQGSLVTFGSAIPKYTGGWINNLSFKGIQIFTQVDFKAGHKIMSNSNLNFLRHGLHKQSLVGREDGGVLFAGVNADGTPNATRVEAETFYSTYRSTGIAAPFVYNGSFVRWRSLSVGYDFSRFVSKTFIKGLNVSAVMDNVLLFRKYLDNLDPEAQVSTSDNLQGIETHTLPTARSYGVNVAIRL